MSYSTIPSKIEEFIPFAQFLAEKIQTTPADFPTCDAQKIFDTLALYQDRKVLNDMAAQIKEDTANALNELKNFVTYQMAIITTNSMDIAQSQLLWTGSVVKYGTPLAVQNLSVDVISGDQRRVNWAAPAISPTNTAAKSYILLVDGVPAYSGTASECIITAPVGAVVVIGGYNDAGAGIQTTHVIA